MAGVGWFTGRYAIPNALFVAGGVHALGGPTTAVYNKIAGVEKQFAGQPAAQAFVFGVVVIGVAAAVSAYFTLRDQLDRIESRLSGGGSAPPPPSVKSDAEPGAAPDRDGMR